MTDQTEAPGLLPCPFCGGKDLYHSGADTEKGYVICDRCGTYGPEATRGSWNDRAALDRVKAEARKEERERCAKIALSINNGETAKAIARRIMAEKG